MDTPGIEEEVFHIILDKNSFGNSCVLNGPPHYGDIKHYKVQECPKWYWRLLNSITFDLIPYLSQKSRTFKIEEV